MSTSARLEKFRLPAGPIRRAPKQFVLRAVVPEDEDEDEDANRNYAEQPIDTSMEGTDPRWAEISAPVLARLCESPATHKQLNEWLASVKVIHKWLLHDAICWLLNEGKIEKIDGTTPAVYRPR